MSSDKKTNIIGGSRGDDAISGTDRDDKILGHGGDDRADGSDGDDRIFGNTGNDVLKGGKGNDWLKGDTRDDILDGGAGSDRVDGGAGNDVAIYVLAENRNSHDDYDGGSGVDTLRLVLTGAEWARSDVKADVARYIAFLADEINPSGQAKGHEFEFRAFGLDATKFEKLEVVVDGRVVYPAAASSIDALNDAASVTEDGSITGNVLANDVVTNLSGVALVTGPAHGTLTLDGTGAYTYVPGAYFNALAAGETASETFVYRVTDTRGNADTATVTLTITGTNDGPVAQADIAAGTENQTLVINVLANDTDPDHGDVLRVTTASVPAGQGTVSVNADNTLAFNPGSAFDHLKAGATATVTASYTVADQQGATDAKSVTITITGTNDAPVMSVVSATGAVQEDGVIAASGKLTATDVDDGATLTWSVAGGGTGTYGTLAVDATGQWTYQLANATTPVQSLTQGQVVTDTFTVRVVDEYGAADTKAVTITITGTNDGPVAHADVAAGTENQTLIIDVLANDTAPAGAVLHVAAASVPAGLGTVTINPDSTLTFNPGAAFDHLKAGATATVIATYTVADQLGATDTATVTITVTGTNDAPVMTVPVAGAVQEDAIIAASGQLTATDADDGAALTWALIGSGAGTYGTLSVDATGKWTYVLQNGATQVQSLAQGEVVSETFNVRVADENGANDTKALTVTVAGTNDGPVARADTAAGTENQPLVINVLANDSDLDHNASLHVSSAAVPVGQGAVTVNADNTLTFNPGTAFDYLAAGEHAAVNVTYTVADQFNASSTQNVLITLTGTNDAPVAHADIYSTDEDQPLSVGGRGVLANDTDPDGSAVLSVLAGTYTSTLGASVTLRADGSFDYDARQLQAIKALHTGQSAADTFTYTVLDEHGAPSTSTVTVNIRGIDHAPVATADSFFANEDTVLIGNVLANDTDLDGDHLVVATTGTIFTPNGNVVMSADGTFAYTPLHNYSGPDSFSYTVSDGQGGTSTVNVGLLVNAVADAPLLSVPENNLGFERGSLAGWSAIGAAAAVQFQNAAPAEKAWMGSIDSGGASDTSVENFLGLAPGALDQVIGGDATIGSGLKTALTVSAGDTVSFQWNFITPDYLPYSDFAFVVTPDGVAYKLSDSGQVGGDGGSGTTGWQSFSMVANHTGVFELRLGVMNVLDTQIDSTLLVDNVQINGSSPDVRGTQDVPIPLDFATALTDLDGSESVTVVMSHMPQGTTFSSGVDAGDGRWILTPAQLPGLTMTTPHDFTGAFTLTVTATSAEASNGSTASVDKDVVVMVQPANNPPVAVSDSAVTNEDTQALINVVANDTDPDREVLTVESLLGTTSALGATLSIVDGKVLYDPSTSAALHALHQGASLTDSFSYVVTDSRGGTSTGQVTVDVAGVDDIGMQGVSLDYTYLYADQNTAIYNAHVTARDGVEVNGLWGAAAPGTLNLTDDRIIIDFDSSGAMDRAAFNGFHLADYANVMPSILDVTVAQNNVAGFDASRVTHDANNVFVNLQGLAYDQSSHIELQVAF